jgi:ABC-2 type transport system permease protein
MLDPRQRVLGIVTVDQIDRAVFSELTVTQSLGVIWPQLVAMVAVTCVIFAIAFVLFMRQEMRA